MDPVHNYDILDHLSSITLCIPKEMSVSLSSTSTMAESRDQTTNFMYERLRSQQVANPTSFLNDNLYEFLQNITIAGAGNRTHAEKRSSKGAAEESIGFHFTKERIEIAMTEMKDVWPAGITVESILRTHLKLRTRKDADTKKVAKVNDDRLKKGQPPLSEFEAADLVNPLLSDADLLARYKSLRTFAENVIFVYQVRAASQNDLYRSKPTPKRRRNNLYSLVPGILQSPFSSIRHQTDSL